MVIFEMYMEFVIAAVQNMKNLGSETFADHFANFTGVITMVLIFGFVPAIFILAYATSSLMFRLRSYTGKFGIIFYDIKTSTRMHA